MERSHDKVMSLGRENLARLLGSNQIVCYLSDQLRMALVEIPSAPVIAFLCY
jgi:hypothetical protein